MSDVTRILDAIEHGDPHAADQLLPLVYDELRRLAAQKLAREAPGQTLTATGLVHEAYLRLVSSAKSPGEKEEVQWDSRGHFFAAAAEAMRRILVESARRKRSRKHGGGAVRHDLDEAILAAGRASGPLRICRRGWSSEPPRPHRVLPLHGVAPQSRQPTCGRDRPRRIQGVFMQADPHKALDALVAAFGGFWTSDRLVIRRIRGLASIDPDFESAVHARDERRQVGIRTILGRLANKRQKRSAAELDEVIAIVQMLTSFETFDNLAGLDRDLDEVVSLVCRLVWAAVARQKAIARLSLQRLRSRFFIAMVRSEDPANGPNA